MTTEIDQLLFDSMTDGSPVSLSGNWGLAPGGVVPVASSAAAIHGALGCRWASTASYGRIDYTYPGGPFTTARVLSFYFNVRTFSTSNHYIAATQDNHTSAQTQGDWRINLARTVSIRNGTTAVKTSTVTLNTGQPYHAQWKIDPVAHTQELRIFDGESSTALMALPGAYSSTTTGIMAFGPYAAAPGGAIDYDTVRIADDWLDPEVAPVQLVPVLRRLWFNGTQWV